MRTLVFDGKNAKASGPSHRRKFIFEELREGFRITCGTSPKRDFMSFKVIRSRCRIA